MLLHYNEYKSKLLSVELSMQLTFIIELHVCLNRYAVLKNKIILTRAYLYIIAYVLPILQISNELTELSPYVGVVPYQAA